MLKLIKNVAILALILFIGLLIYSYFGDLSAPQEPVTIPIDIHAD